VDFPGKAARAVEGGKKGKAKAGKRAKRQKAGPGNAALQSGSS
jgi:hypothetical protein